MDVSMRAVLQDYYADLLGVDQSAVWQGVTVQPHVGRLSGYEGFHVAWKSAGVHVSVPADADLDALGSLTSEKAAVLQDPAYWHRFAELRGLRVLGPSTHSYLDRDPGVVDGVEAASGLDLQSLREEVPAADWTESGWDDNPAHRVRSRPCAQLCPSRVVSQHQLLSRSARTCQELARFGIRLRGV